MYENSMYNTKILMYFHQFLRSLINVNIWSRCFLLLLKFTLYYGFDTKLIYSRWAHVSDYVIIIPWRKFNIQCWHIIPRYIICPFLNKIWNLFIWFSSFIEKKNHFKCCKHFYLLAYWNFDWTNLPQTNFRTQ